MSAEIKPEDWRALCKCGRTGAAHASGEAGPGCTGFERMDPELARALDDMPDRPPCPACGSTEKRLREILGAFVGEPDSDDLRERMSKAILAEFPEFRSSSAVDVLDESVAAMCDRCRHKELPDPGQGKTRHILGMHLWLCARCWQEVFPEQPGCPHDDPELDGTDGAHPAWWRGQAAGVESAAREISEILVYPTHGLSGGCAEPWQTVRRTVATMAINLGCLAVDLGAAAQDRAELETLRVLKSEALERIADQEREIESYRLDWHDFREALTAARFFRSGWRRLAAKGRAALAEARDAAEYAQGMYRIASTERDEQRAALEETRQGLIITRAEVRKLRRAVRQLRSACRIAEHEQPVEPVRNTLRAVLKETDALGVDQPEEPTT